MRNASSIACLRALASTSRSRATRAWQAWIVMGICALAGCDDPAPALTNLMEARKLAAELRLHYSKANEATNRAVMAGTDELSAEFAHEARNEMEAVNQGIGHLESLVSSLEYAEEASLMKQFRREFIKCRQVEEALLKMAVENTNLKAQQLSFGKGQEAARAFNDALSEAISKTGQKPTATGGRVALNSHGACFGAEISTLHATALLGLREMQVLEAPHIATLDEGTMVDYEKQMGESLAKSTSALDALAQRLDPAHTTHTLEPAREAFARFLSVHQEVLNLSHRNTNARSFSLTLGENRKVGAVCEAKLDAVLEELKRHAFAATR